MNPSRLYQGGFFLTKDMKISKPKRTFVAQDLKINTWADIEPYFKDLSERELSSAEALKTFLKNRSELDAVLEEDLAWRYIKMTIDTNNESHSKAYSNFISEISPEASKWDDKLNRLTMSSEFVEELKSSDAYAIYLRSIESSIALFREENIPLQTKVQDLAKEYGSIAAKQSIELNGETLTMQQASVKLKSQDEALRKEVFEKMVARRAEDRKALDELFNELVGLRDQIAHNAGFDNFRDYKFVSMGRHDYIKEDCFDFHKAVEEHVVPLASKIQKKQADKLNQHPLKPWNTEVDPEGKDALNPFKNGKDLLEKSIAVFKKIDPYFADCLSTMDEMNHLDLESKAGKAPGGYNYPLYEIGVPFIFMNAAGAHRDVITMIHEGGHAVHSFLSRDLELTSFKDVPSEVAELASMSMELLSMPYWEEFYEDADDLQRAKREHLEDIICVLPWIACIDAFQHWIYENPKHAVEERTAAWLELRKRFGNPHVDWSGFEFAHESAWHRQLHLFEVPFYYIEYGMAQLGAIQMYHRYVNNHDEAIENYKNALSLGYTKSIPEIYKAGNISFDFSASKIKELMSFTENILNDL